MTSTVFQVNGAEVSKDEFQEIITTKWEKLPEKLKQGSLICTLQRPQGVSDSDHEEEQEIPLPPLEECQEASTTGDSVVDAEIIGASETSGSSSVSVVPVKMNFEERFTQRGWNMWMREQQLEREYQLAMKRYKGYKHFRNRILGAIENEPDWKDKYNQGQLKTFSTAICPPLESKKAPKICEECKQNPREDGKMGEVPCGVAVTRPISQWATKHVEKVKKGHYFYDTKPVTPGNMEVSYQVVDVVPSQEWKKVPIVVIEDGTWSHQNVWLGMTDMRLAEENDLLLDEITEMMHKCTTREQFLETMAEARNLLEARYHDQTGHKQEILEEWETTMTQLASSRSPTQEPREEAQEKASSD